MYCQLYTYPQHQSRCYHLKIECLVSDSICFTNFFSFQDLEKLVRAGLRNPVLVSVKDKEGTTLSTPSSLDNFFTVIPEPSKKLAFLLKFVEKMDKCIVFFSTCACVEYFSTCIERLHKGRVFCLISKT